jgi:uncharacterized protein (TIGR00730 family)
LSTIREGSDAPRETSRHGEVPPEDRKPPDTLPHEHPTEDERLLERVEDIRTIGNAWRIFRIMGEFVEGFEEMSEVGRSVSIFGSARVGPEDPIFQQCVETARLLGEAGFGIITGGGPGIMEAANKGAKLAGATSVGCNIELPFEQRSNEFLDVSIDFRYFFVRKTMFVKYAEAFVIFPGGYGTLDELFEALTLIQTNKVRDFPVVLFGSAYWEGLLGWLRETTSAEGMIAPADLDLMLVTDEPAEVTRHIVHRYEGRHARDGTRYERRRRERRRSTEQPGL